ncbi:preprotein translocase subunit YajC [uncultured Vagococcus sp.]|uniref:preprotein translocase subunit YajC n=1 Tax=uncultured Vagococcus sp. TaxID=189676 RepID=UPI0028D4B75C|nr:preprotein translocase subunit YajC [uncultured Vagococcus sp.]
MGGLGSFLPMIVIMGGMVWWMSRSQKKQQQKRQDLLNTMDIGSKVVTIGGLHGVISEVNTDKSTVVLDCEGIFLEFNRSAISSVTPPEVTETIVPDGIMQEAPAIEVEEEIVEDTTDEEVTVVDTIEEETKKEEN